MEVSKIMTRDVVTVDVGASVREAASNMRDKNVGSAVVVRDGNLAGMVSDRDVAVRATAEGWDPNAHQVAEIMTPNPVSISPQTDTMEVCRLIGQHKVRRLPVIEDHRVVGVVSCADLAHQLRDELDSILAETSKAEH